MQYKNMLGTAIYSFRKRLGISQAELGKRVGVSNKAVSKWETEEANPDIAILPKLAAVLGVTIEELYSGAIEMEEEKLPNKAKLFNIEGIVTDNDSEYEFVSDKKTKKGTPYLHVHYGKTLASSKAKARGVIAVGNIANGVISVGLVSTGIISVGIVSVGILSFGLVAFGALCVSMCLALGFTAIGGVAVGIVAFGGVAIGVVSFGGVAIGLVSYGGVAVDYLMFGKAIIEYQHIRHLAL